MIGLMVDIFEGPPEEIPGPILSCGEIMICRPRKKCNTTALEISNLAAVIAQGRHSPSLLAELERREKRLSEISDEIFSSSANGLDAKLREIEDFVMRRLGDLHGLLTGDVQRAKSELAKHGTEITLTPEGQTYQISGDWDLFGGRSDGAGGPART